MVCHGLATFADALRAGSAEAKGITVPKGSLEFKMHSVQAAPRQRKLAVMSSAEYWDALRAGSAEAKSDL